MAVIALVGNPNCGKTTIFNALTGATQTVGNWPGVTVELKRGVLSHKDRSFDIVDLPGIYALSATSPDEKIAMDFILENNVDLVVNILDAANLERNLYLTIQLIEMQVPCLVVLNMMDEAARRNIKVDLKALSELLDICVVPTSAQRGDGIADLRQAIACSCQNQKISAVTVHYPDELENEIKRLQNAAASCPASSRRDARWLALKMMSDQHAITGCSTPDTLRQEILHCRQRLNAIYGEDADMLMADTRYGLVNAVTRKAVDRSGMTKFDISDMIDRIVLDRFWGIPVFLVIMYLAFWTTINLGGCFIDFFDIAAGAVFVNIPIWIFQSLHLPPWLITILANGAGGGMQVVATFIPPIFFMFLCLAILDDSGYMARAAFVMDRAMRVIGLPGKAFVPLLIGFGCNVPAILATRTLEDKNDRIITIMMNPFMSCGARLPIYAVFAIAFFQNTGGIVIFALYLIGILIAALTAVLLRQTLLPGSGAAFIMELPPYHIPTFQGIILHTWQRLKGFIIKAGKAIMMVVIILTILNNIPLGPSAQEKTQNSLLSNVGKFITPVFTPMGIKEDNWPASVGIVTGVLFKESVIATLDALYAPPLPITARETSTSRVVLDKLKEAWQSIQDNIRQLQHPFAMKNQPTMNASVAEYHLRATTYEALRTHFDGAAGAFAFLLFVLLYMPCISTIGAVFQELGWRWTTFSIIYLSLLAWSVATIFYQAVRFQSTPLASMGWILLASAILTGIVIFLKIAGSRLLKINLPAKSSCQSGCSSCASCR